MAVVAVFPLVNAAGQYEAPLDYSTGVEQGLVARGFYPQKLATPLTAPTTTTGIEYDGTDAFLVVKTEGTKISLQIGGNEYAWLSNAGEFDSVSFKANATSGNNAITVGTGAKVKLGNMQLRGLGATNQSLELTLASATPYAYTNSATGGDLVLNVGASDTPAVKFIYGANVNYAIDVASGLLRFVTNIDEASGAVRMSMDSSGNLTVGASGVGTLTATTHQAAAGATLDLKGQSTGVVTGVRVGTTGNISAGGKVVAFFTNNMVNEVAYIDSLGFLSTAPRRWYETRTLPTVVGNYVELGSFNIVNGSHSFQMHIAIPGSGYSGAKHYTISSIYNLTGANWLTVPPISDGGPYASNDIALEINVNAAVTSLRIRRVSGSTAATAYVTIISGEVDSATWTAASGTGTSTASGYFDPQNLRSTLKGVASDGASAVGNIIDTYNALANAAAKVLSIRNNGVEISALSSLGSFTAVSAAFGGISILAGFRDRTTSSLSFVNGTRVFTITPIGSYDFWANNIKYAKSTNQTVTIANSVGLHFVYFDAAGALVESTTPWDLLSDQVAPVATVYWDGTTGVVDDERHGAFRNRNQHAYLHNTRGTAYDSGLAGTFTDTTFSIATGAIWDEDIKHTLTGPFTTCRMWYRTVGSGAMRVATSLQATAYAVFGQLQYDNNGSLQAVGSNKYTVSWVYATNDIAAPIAVVVSQFEYVNLGDARAASQPSFPSLSTREWKLIYSVTYQNSGGSPTFVEAVDYRNASVLPNATVTSLPAISVTFTPTGTIASTNVQAAIEELLVESGVVPGGADTYVQFNDGGTFGGSSSLTYDKTLNRVTVTAGVDGTNMPGFRVDAYSTGVETYNDAGFYLYRGINQVLRMKAGDSGTQLRGHWFAADYSTSGLITDFDLGCNETETFLTAANRIKIENTSGELWIHGEYDVNIWSTGPYVEIGPPNDVTGPAWSDFTENQILAFRGFDNAGVSTDMGEIVAYWRDVANYKHGLRITSNGRITLNTPEVYIQHPDGVASVLLLTSPNGTIYALTVDDDGVLTTTEAP